MNIVDNLTAAGKVAFALELSAQAAGHLWDAQATLRYAAKATEKIEYFRRDDNADAIARLLMAKESTDLLSELDALLKKWDRHLEKVCREAPEEDDHAKA